MITRDEIWQRVEHLNVWRRGKQQAPHKPLLLLLSLSRLTQRLPRLATFDELEDPLKQLLIRYGPPRRSQHPEYLILAIASRWTLGGSEFGRPDSSEGKHGPTKA